MKIKRNYVNLFEKKLFEKEFIESVPPPKYVYLFCSLMYHMLGVECAKALAFNTRGMTLNNMNISFNITITIVSERIRGAS